MSDVPHVFPADTRPPVRIWVRSVRRNMLRLIPSLAYVRPFVTESIGPLRWHVAASPAAFRHIFRDRRHDYPKAPIMRRMLAPYLGDSIFMADGPDWAAQRSALGPAFRASALRDLGPAMQTAAERMATSLDRQADTGAEVAMSFQMRVLAMEMVRHTMFQGLAEAVADRGDGSCNPDTLAACRSDLQGELDRFLQTFGRPGPADLLDLPRWMRPARWVFRPPTIRARALILDLIRERRDTVASGAPADMLDLLLALKAPDGSPMLSDHQIRDNLMTFLVTGSDTTAVALTWSIYMLSQRPDWARRLRIEADAALATRTGAEAVDAMPQTQAFLNEVLRLFPPAPILVRKAARDDRICGVPVRRGDTVFCPIYALHRHPAVWEAPLTFRPERFLHDAPRAPYAYLPFGAGPRACIGAGFAILEACLTLGTLVRRFDIRLAPGWQVRPIMMLTLKPEGGLPVLLSRRGAGDTTTAHQKAA